MAEPSPSSASWWKFTATGLAGVVSSLAVMYVGVLPNYATEAEVRKILLTESPYLIDRKSIEQRTDSNQRAVEQLTKDIKVLVESNASLNAQMKIYLDRRLGSTGSKE